MADRLQFFLDLIDRVSGPADKITKNLKSLRTGLESTVGTTWPALKVVGQGMATVAKYGAVAGAAVLGLGVAGAKMAIDSASFKRNTLAGLELMTGSKNEAEKVYGLIKGFADTSPFTTEFVTASFKQLLGSGLSASEVQNTLKGIFDVGAIIGGAEGEQAASAITEKIVKMRSLGKLTTDALNEIAMASGGLINTGKFADQLAKMKGISSDAVKKMIETGKVSAGDATQALLATIQQSADKGGPLGSAMETFGSGSLEGQLSTLKSRFSDMFSGVNIEPLIGMLKVFNNVLSESTPEGKHLREVLNATFGEVFQKIASLFTADNVTKFVEVLGTTIKFLYDLTEALGSGIMEGFNSIIGPLGEFLGENTDGVSIMEGTIAVFKFLGQAIGFLAAVVAYAVVGIIGAFVLLWEGFDYLVQANSRFWTGLRDGIAGIGDWFANLATEAWDWGASIVDGIWDGVKSTWAGMLQGFSDLVDLLPDAVKKVLGIASPSKVMMRLGVNTMQGFTRGIESQAANTNGSLAGAATPPAVQPIAGAIAGAASGGSGGNVVNITVPMTASADVSPSQAQEQGRNIGRGIAAELSDYFEGLAVAVGA